MKVSDTNTELPVDNEEKINEDENIVEIEIK